MDSSLRILDACSMKHFQAMSLLHAKGWREAYRDVFPQSYMDREITDQRWVPAFQENWRTGVNHGLLMLDGDRPVCAAVYGPARIGPQTHGGTLTIRFDAECYRGWGELISIYSDPALTRRGYGHTMVREVFARLEAQKMAGCLVYVLRENLDARRFYEREGFSWDGNWTDIPFPPDIVCRDLRYACPFSPEAAP